MLKITLETFKNNWKRYAWSSIVTFVTVFTLTLAFLVQTLNFDSLESAGIYGAVGMVVRLVLKAIFEGLKGLIIWWAEKIKDNN